LAAEVFLDVVGKDFCDKLIVNAINTVQTPGKIAEIIDRWNQKYKDPFISDAVPAFDVIWVTAQALNKAQSTDARKVISTFENMVRYGDLITAHGAGKMGEKERFGVNRVLVRPIPVTHVLKGQIVSFDLVTPE
jgi:ABC-type branched-subunit amino acid transport system substrate-binding protein